jgi:energy-coupling factor transporter ATP-binding protein EcfA2
VIKSVEMKNLRGIQEGKLDELTPLVVLVGPNGSGKSTILDALLLAASPVPGFAVRELGEHRLRMHGGEKWLLKNADSTKKASIDLSTDQAGVRRVEISGMYDPMGIWNGIKFSIPGNDAMPADLVIGSLDERSSSLSNESVPLNGVAEVHLIGFQSEKKTEPLEILYSKAVRSGHRKELNAIVSAVVPGVSHMEIVAEGQIPLIDLVFDNYSVPAALAGDGVQALLRLSLELASKAGGVVLLEEPEVHQHPAAIRQSAKAILAAVRRGIQVILTTHSMDLLDSLLAEVSSDEELEKLSVYRTKLVDGCLRTSRISGPDVAFSRVEIGDDLR